jgi:hypothetical protein
MERASDLDLLTDHEAGHAAVAVAMGFRLRAVQIDPLTEDGVTQLAEGEQTTRLQQAINLLAGARAELILDPSSLMWRLSAWPMSANCWRSLQSDPRTDLNTFLRTTSISLHSP